MESIAARRGDNRMESIAAPTIGWNRSPDAEMLSTSDNRMESIAASTTGLEVLANGASIAPKGLPLSLEL